MTIKQNSDEILVCEQCENEVNKDDSYCINCGANFADSTFCNLHGIIHAEGVCLVCQKSCCGKCGIYINGTFLCEEHSSYEIYEGMARVYGSSDSVNVDFLKSVLEQEGLHPFIYSRKASPISLGGSDYSLFRASGDFMGNIINEIKIMVPLNEVLKAEALLE